MAKQSKSEASSKKRGKKKSYARPGVRAYGNIREITRTANLSGSHHDNPNKSGTATKTFVG